MKKTIDFWKNANRLIENGSTFDDVYEIIIICALEEQATILFHTPEGEIMHDCSKLFDELQVIQNKLNEFNETKRSPH